MSIEQEQTELNNAFLDAVNDTLEARGNSKVQSLTPHSFFKILSAVFAPVVWALKRLITRKIRALYPVFVETADEVNALLGLYGLAQIKNGTNAAGSVTATLTDSYIISAGTELYTGDKIYTVDANKTLTTTDNTFNVTAVAEGGAYNLNSGTTLMSQSPIAEISRFSTGVISGGTEAESVGEAKGRLLSHIRAVRTGGTVDDYSNWAKEVVGVKNVYVLGNRPTQGEVTVLITSNSYQNYIPDETLINKVKTELEKKIVLGSIVHVSAPVVKTINVSITGLVGTAKSIDIEKALRQWLFENAAPSKTIYSSELSAVISGVAGETGHILTSPVGSVRTAHNEIHVLGTVS